MKTIANTAESLSSLGLCGMAEAYERQLEDPALLSQPFETRLGLMMDAEKSERETRKIERLLKAAKLRETQATLETIEFKASRGLDRNTIMTLGECEWLRRRQNVIITGATGTGKTWLACALGNQACRQGIHTMLCHDKPELFVIAQCMPTDATAALQLSNVHTKNSLTVERTLHLSLHPLSKPGIRHERGMLRHRRQWICGPTLTGPSYCERVQDLGAYAYPGQH